MATISNLIFDWSGVISNDFELGYKTISQILKRYGGPDFTFEEFKLAFEMPLAKFYQKVLPQEDPEIIGREFFGLLDSVGFPTVYPGAADVVQKLASQDNNLLIFSSHDTEKLNNELERFAISPSLFKEINGNVKNKVESIVETLERNAWDASATAYIGDMEHDIEAAKKAGIISIASTYGYRPKEKLISYNPDYYLEDISDLPALLESLSV